MNLLLTLQLILSLFTNSLTLEIEQKLSTYGKYFFEFYTKVHKDFQEKIDWVFELVKTVDHIPIKSQSFILGELLKDEREKANLTQAEMAEKTGTKKSYISRIENGRADIQLSTLYRLIEQGLNRKLKLSIH